MEFLPIAIIFYSIRLIIKNIKASQWSELIILLLVIFGLITISYLAYWFWGGGEKSTIRIQRLMSKM